ncbi:penicillin-binding protein 2 [Sulfurovum sp. zt1-1]|uniref:Penicillin-binding protein 2 n=1 Tax=Sulfurovum zhangzhouensis TaxID=3019067 RepID=A0ABT7QZG2_9BACT|nr:penicillin-binding protein 2 [Sulfurovum zhangzhouensis]MDM5272234.1 penicillin-binding protein 2 [Sulfurovum zhangzhouensis]
MKEAVNNRAIRERSNKVLTIFLLLVLLVVVFLMSVIHTIQSDRRIPSEHAKIHDRSLRGSIISADGYTLSYSQKTYQAVIRGASIKPEKRELFIKFFSIYSGIPIKAIQERFTDKKGRLITGNIVLSKELNAKSAMQLKELAHKLRKMDVFQWVENGNGVKVLYGLDIIENGESRRFPLKDILSPTLGYVGDRQEGRYIRPQGKKGLERKYEEHITSKKNGYFQGKRDVIGTVIHDKNSMKIKRIDGLDLHLNIPLALQRHIEIMLDAMKTQLDADEIIVGVMKSDTGELLSLASSERFDPSHITQKDIPALNPKFAEYPYEAGSVLKPLTLSIALSHGVITPRTMINTENGKMKIGKFTIRDDDKFESLDAAGIIIHSSNIGSSKISWKLTGKEFRDGLLAFGVARPSGIDLSRDLPGSLKPLYLLNHELHRASTSYGYGMQITFAQLFKAYSAFNNGGIAVTPRIVSYLEDAKGNHYTLEPEVPDLHAIDPKTAQTVHDILIRVVQEGTGVKAKYPGLEIGGKTGTAHIARKGHYLREYHSSFYGFANDKEGNKYTIGVLVIKAKKYRKYFASLSAVPTFRNIVEILVDQNYLKPDPDASEQIATNEMLYQIEENEPSLPETPEDIETVANKPASSQVKPSSSTSKPKNTITDLFKLKEKPQQSQPKPYVEPVQQPLPVKDNNPHKLFEDLF